jgi:hypothetical protein
MSLTSSAEWPPLDLAQWQETQIALQLRTQVVGKTRLALSPAQNHWWHSALYVTTRGLGTSPMPHGVHTVEVDFDFLDHALIVRRSDGAVRTLPLRPQPMAEFFDEYRAALRSLDIEIPIWPMPVEMNDPVPFTADRAHSAYDRDAVEACFRVLVQVDRVLKSFRSRFLGKSSPSHFWWGGFDMACTRFSGRDAPRHPGGIPHMPDFVAVETYSHECISAGWWPGTPGGPIAESAFYAYAYPEPPGCGAAPIRPSVARYDQTLHEWILPYHEVVRAADPDALVFEFLQATYDIASGLGSWSSALERIASK